MSVSYPQGLALVSVLTRCKPLSEAAAIALGIDPPDAAAFSSRDVEALDRCEVWIAWIREHLQAVEASLSNRERQSAFDFDRPAEAADSNGDHEIEEDLESPIKPTQAGRKKPSKPKPARA